MKYLLLIVLMFGTSCLANSNTSSNDTSPDSASDTGDDLNFSDYTNHPNSPSNVCNQFEIHNNWFICVDQVWIDTGDPPPEQQDPTKSILPEERSENPQQ